MSEHTLNKNLAVRQSHVTGTVPASSVYGNWIDVRGYDRVMFVAQVQTLDDDCDLTVYQNSAAQDSGAAIVTGATDDFINGTDENRAGVIEIGTGNLTDGNYYVALRVTPASALAFFGAVAYLTKAHSEPVANGTAENIAWVVNL